MSRRKPRHRNLLKIEDSLEGPAEGFSSTFVTGKQALHEGELVATAGPMLTTSWQVAWVTHVHASGFLRLINDCKIMPPDSQVRLEYRPSSRFPHGTSQVDLLGSLRASRLHEVECFEVSAEDLKMRWSVSGLTPEDPNCSIRVLGVENDRYSRFENFDRFLFHFGDLLRITLPREHRIVGPEILRRGFVIEACLGKRGVDYFGEYGKLDGLQVDLYEGFGEECNEEVVILGPVRTEPRGLCLDEIAIAQNASFTY